MKSATVATLLACLGTAAAQGVTISLPSGVSLPSGITLPSGVSIVTAGATSTAQANANRRYHKRQNGGFSISGLSIGLQRTANNAAAQQTDQANAANAGNA
ncbi:uncharacterized protein P884DRAFT_298031 [Thermothelomyces heterothallicus CBS 202.75]|uniref:uncharacterized protein n=1 Tax=Thermothelomyces heterothallicus CBS 202.75 TaxID=1149848 RepID=UPI003743A31A